MPITAGPGSVPTFFSVGQGWQSVHYLERGQSPRKRESLTDSESFCLENDAHQFHSQFIDQSQRHGQAWVPSVGMWEAPTGSGTKSSWTITQPAASAFWNARVDIIVFTCFGNSPTKSSHLSSAPLLPSSEPNNFPRSPANLLKL